MWYQLLHKDHPVWPILRIFSITVSVAVILVLNARKEKNSQDFVNGSC